MSDYEPTAQALARAEQQLFMHAYYERVTAPLVLYAEPNNNACDSIYCNPRECNGVIKVCNDGEKILCKCSCHRKVTGRSDKCGPAKAAR